MPSAIGRFADPHQYPGGTEHRCCWTCGLSSNAAPTAKPPAGMVIKCLRFGRQEVPYWSRCGEFILWSEHKGWPDLPPSAHPEDRKTRGET